MRVEVNMVVNDTLKSAIYYGEFFGAKTKSKTNEQLGMNEAIIILANVELRLLDENKELKLIAPKANENYPMSLNIFVDNIKAVFNKVQNMESEIIISISKTSLVNNLFFVYRDKHNHV